MENWKLGVGWKERGLLTDRDMVSFLVTNCNNCNHTYVATRTVFPWSLGLLVFNSGIEALCVPLCIIDDVVEVKLHLTENAEANRLLILNLYPFPINIIPQ